MMEPQPLYYVWDYRDIDREFWQQHLEGWLPRRIFDAHMHIINPALRREPMTEEARRQYWVSEACDSIDAPTAARCCGLVFPGREVKCLTLGAVDLAYDVEASNDYVRAEAAARGWPVLSSLISQWSAQRLAAELDKPGVVGVKPYYSLIGRNPFTRDEHIEASIFDFLPHQALEVLDDRRAWVTLHVPKAGRLGHPDNIREVREIRRRYPNIVLVIAHLGRSYTEEHALEALPALADDAGLHFDVSAVLNPAVHRLAMKVLGPGRLLYGTDNPVFYMRGRRSWQGRQYINHTGYDFHFNRGRHELPDVEARYTLYMYEALKAIKDAAIELALSRRQIEGIFHDNAQALLAKKP